LEQKRSKGCAHRFPPMYAGANMGHPSDFLTDPVAIRHIRSALASKLNCHLDRSVAEWRDLRFFLRRLPISDPGASQIPVAHANQVEQTVQSEKRDGVTGGLPHQRLCPERDAHAGDAQHGQIVGAVPDRNHLV
jgi:hypothetical protein